MLYFKRVCDDTIGIMRDAVGGGVDYYDAAVESVCDFVSEGEVHVLNSANSCLITVAESIPWPVLVCDMGGWNGFIRSCEVFGKSVEYLETRDGIINIEVLNNYLEENDVKSLYITSLAGYTAPQPLEEIADVCDVHEVLLVVDISGSVGDKKTVKYGDILVSSTGSPKIVNIENGGFICNRSNITFNKHLLKSLKADNITCAGIAHEIRKAPEILHKTMQINRYLKDKLKEKNVELVHPTEYGLNTMIIAPSKSKAKRLAHNIRERLEVDGNIITTGPNYNRVKRACVTVEIKNLDVNTVIPEDVDNLVNIILEELENIQ